MSDLEIIKKALRRVIRQRQHDPAIANTCTWLLCSILEEQDKMEKCDKAGHDDATNDAFGSHGQG